MKKIIPILVIALMSGMIACKKSEIPPASMVTALNVVNATIGTSPLVIKHNNYDFIYAKLTSSNKMAYGGYFLLSPPAGASNYQFIQSTDTLHTLLDVNLNLPLNTIHSLFLTGTTAQPDTLLTQDPLPHYGLTDSVGGIRFVNLSAGSNPVSVDIRGQANGAEVQSLSYKGITGFKSYAATSATANYTFEFRDVSSGNLLATYTISGVSTKSPTVGNTFRFKNHTLALIGQPDATGTAAQKVILINNY